MKPAWFAAFVLSVLWTSLSHPQQVNPPLTPPENPPLTKAATTAGVPTPPVPQAASAAPAAAQPASEQALVLPAAPSDLTEDQLRQAFLGKHLFLRGLWLSDDLHFSLSGVLLSQSAKGSFTLCEVQIDKVRLSKRRLELEGARYGIHFEDEGNWATQADSFDRIRITPKKKNLLIVIDRQEIVSPKKDKKRHEKGSDNSVEQGIAAQPASAPPAPSLKSETTSPAESAAHLRAAIDKIFAPSLDPSMVAAMPDYWQYFYQAQLRHQSIEPTDPSIVHPGPGVHGPTLVHNVVPPSNDYAQKSQIAGVATYKVILGPDGKPIAIAVFRPIGFGLDENAVAAIRKSTFTAALKDGKPVSSVIDLSVSFRILSDLTSRPAAPDTANLPPGVSPVTGKPSLPGPYSTAVPPASPQP